LKYKYYATRGIGRAVEKAPSFGSELAPTNSTGDSGIVNKLADVRVFSLGEGGESSRAAARCDVLLDRAPTRTRIDEFYIVLPKGAHCRISVSESMKEKRRISFAIVV